MGAVDGDDAHYRNPPNPGIGASRGRRRFGTKSGSAIGLTGRSDSKGEVVKRIILLALLGSLAVVLPIGLVQGAAKADEGPQVIIQQDASYNLAGAVINVGLNVKCQGGSGDVVVNVTQSPPETPYPIGEIGRAHV